MAITFQQVNNPSFADSNRLLEVALAQSAKAAEGLQGILNTAVGNVENANLAKIQQLVNSQTREQLQDPIYQQQMQGQIAQMLESTGGTIDPLKANALVQDRIDKLMGRETTQSNLNSAAITQEGMTETNKFNKKHNSILLDIATRNNLTESETKLAKDIAGTYSFYADRIAATNDPVIQKELQAQQNLDIAKFGYIPPHVYDSAMTVTKEAAKADEKFRREGLLVDSRLKTDATNRLIGTIGADNQTRGVELQAARLAAQAGTATNTEKAAVAKETKAILAEGGITPKAVKSDNTIDLGIVLQNTRSTINTAMAELDKSEKTYEDYVLGLGKDDTFSPAQKSAFNKVIARSGLTDAQKIAFKKKYQLSPKDAEGWTTLSTLGIGYEGYFEQELAKFFDSNTGNGNIVQDRKGEVKREKYQNMFNTLVKTGMTIEDIVKEMNINEDSPDYEYMPAEVITATGGDLAKVRAGNLKLKEVAKTNADKLKNFNKQPKNKGQEIRNRKLSGNGLMN